MSESGLPKRRSGPRGPRRIRFNAQNDRITAIARDLMRNNRPHGQKIILVESFLGKVTNSNDDGSALFPGDPRYEILKQLPKWDLNLEDLLTLENDRYPSDDQQIIVATNLSESASSHSLAEDTIAHVFGIVVPKYNSLTHYFFVSGGIAGFFPVKVQCTNSGTGQGTGTTANTFVYTARTMDWNGSSGGSVLGTNLTPTFPRPFGYTTIQSGSVGVGSGYIDAGVFKLREAGEVYGVGPCA